MPKFESEDPRYFVASGRRWRKTDPNIPPSLVSQLTKQLMAARRDVKSALAANDTKSLRTARRHVNDAKTALGERGPKWWEPYDQAGLHHRMEAIIRALLRQRDVDKTICPSEAARVADGSDWRRYMGTAVAVAWGLEEELWLVVTQGGSPVKRPTKGPIRLRKAISGRQTDVNIRANFKRSHLAR